MAYLDHIAGAPLWPQALVAMERAAGQPGNPASLHGAGRAARHILDACGDALRSEVKAPHHRVVLTSGGMEANTLAICGLACSMRKERQRTGVVFVGPSNPDIIACARRLHEDGFVVQWALWGTDNAAALAAVEDLLDTSVGLLVITAVHQDSGFLAPLVELSRLAQRRAIIVHCDGVAALGRTTLSLQETGIHSLAVDSHAVAGPRGVGALVLHKDLSPVPLWHGGGQEWGFRSGSQPTVLAAGFHAVLEALPELRNRLDAAARLGEKLERSLVTSGLWQGVYPNRLWERRVWSIVPVCVPNISGQALASRLDAAGVCVGLCSSSPEGLVGLAHGSERWLGQLPGGWQDVVRLSLGHTTTVDDVEQSLPVLLCTAEELGAQR